MKHHRTAFVLMLLLLVLALAACGPATPEGAITPAAGAGGAEVATGAGSAAGGALPVLGEVVEAPGGSHQRLAPEAYDRLLSEVTPVLLNVQTNPTREIEGTDHTVDYLAVPQNLALIPEREAAIALYCETGDLAEKAARKLVSFGYSGVYVLEGGLEAWEAAGYPTVAR